MFVSDRIEKSISCDWRACVWKLEQVAIIPRSASTPNAVMAIVAPYVQPKNSIYVQLFVVCAVFAHFSQPIFTDEDALARHNFWSKPVVSS